MQLAIELPDELVFDIQNILKQQDIKQFAQEAIKSKFLQEKEAQQQKELMTLIRAIKPVKAPYSSEDMVRMLVIIQTPCFKSTGSLGTGNPERR